MRSKLYELVNTGFANLKAKKSIFRRRKTYLITPYSIDAIGETKSSWLCFSQCMSHR